MRDALRSSVVGNCWFGKPEERPSIVQTLTVLEMHELDKRQPIMYATAPLVSSEQFPVYIFYL